MARHRFKRHSKFPCLRDLNGAADCIDLEFSRKVSTGENIH